MTTLDRRSVSQVAPASEPLTLDEVKKHLEIAEGDHAHDDQLLRLTTAAREVWEHDTQTLVVERSVTEQLSNFPVYPWRFYYQPVASVEAITYFDLDGDTQTVDAAVYSLDLPNRQILLAPDAEWPAHEIRWDAVQVTYTGGSATYPEIAKSAMLLQISMLFGDDTISREYQNWEKAYNNLVIRYQRSSYP